MRALPLLSLFTCLLLVGCPPAPPSDDDDDSAGDDDDDDSPAGCVGVDALSSGQMSGLVDGAAWLDQGATWLSNPAAGTIQIQSTRVDELQVTLMVRQGEGQPIIDRLAEDDFPISVALGDLAEDDGSAVARIGGVSHTAEDGDGGLLTLLGDEDEVLVGCFTATVAVPGGAGAVVLEDMIFRVPLL